MAKEKQAPLNQEADRLPHVQTLGDCTRNDVAPLASHLMPAYKAWLRQNPHHELNHPNHDENRTRTKDWGQER